MYRLTVWPAPIWGIPSGCYPTGLHHYHPGYPQPRAFPLGFPHNMDSVTQVTNSMTSAVHCLTSNAPMMIGSSTDDMERSPRSQDGAQTTNGLLNGEHSAVTDPVSPVVPQFIPTRKDENASIVSPSAGSISKRLSGSDLDDSQPSAFVPTKKTKLDFSDTQDCFEHKVSYSRGKAGHNNIVVKRRHSVYCLVDELRQRSFSPLRRTKNKK